MNINKTMYLIDILKVDLSKVSEYDEEGIKLPIIEINGKPVEKNKYFPNPEAYHMIQYFKKNAEVLNSEIMAKTIVQYYSNDKKPVALQFPNGTTLFRSEELESKMNSNTYQDMQNNFNMKTKLFQKMYKIEIVKGSK